MIDCSTLYTRCSVSANEQMICSLIWGVKYILLPLLIFAIGLVIYQTYKFRRKKTNDKQKN